ncbi:hypothetical protein CcCBS67573_g09120 [Chytriomyces confervae]|uniref:CBS domain-containing protein n=1 Tax=Chytriomyces confervae TaxID=246404 RepID=A0A507E4C2_9FUNG|nr:hypothetical protein CcCBS67573_g09120 [Chytriomyces confervae]
MLHQANKTDSDILTASKEVFNALSKIPISALLAHKRASQGTNSHPTPSQLISVDESMPLRDVLVTLAKHSILAVPVTSHPVQQPEDTGFAGIVSIYDVLAWTVFQKMFDSLQSLDSSPNNANHFGQQAVEYFNTPVSELIGCTVESSTSWTLHSTDFLSTLLQMITRPPFHRMLVIDVDAAIESVDVEMDKEGNTEGNQRRSCIAMVTQMDLLRFVNAHADAIAPFALARLYSIGVADVLGYARRQGRTDQDPKDIRSDGVTVLNSMHVNEHGVVVVGSHVTALQAFRVMYVHRVSAVAIVSRHGEIVANLSASDLRGVTGDLESLQSFLLPVFEFLETRSGKRGLGSLKADQLKCVDREHAFGQAVKTVLEEGIHRVWVQDSAEIPAGVLTVGDMPSLFVPPSHVVSETSF